MRFSRNRGRRRGFRLSTPVPRINCSDTLRVSAPGGSAFPSRALRLLGSFRPTAPVVRCLKSGSMLPTEACGLSWLAPRLSTKDVVLNLFLSRRWPERHRPPRRCWVEAGEYFHRQPETPAGRITSGSARIRIRWCVLSFLYLLTISPMSDPIARQNRGRLGHSGRFRSRGGSVSLVPAARRPGSAGRKAECAARASARSGWMYPLAPWQPSDGWDRLFICR